MKGKRIKQVRLNKSVKIPGWTDYTDLPAIQREGKPWCIIEVSGDYVCIRLHPHRIQTQTEGVQEEVLAVPLYNVTSILWEAIPKADASAESASAA